jgi:hypothetical protein
MWCSDGRIDVRGICIEECRVGRCNDRISEITTWYRMITRHAPNMSDLFSTETRRGAGHAREQWKPRCSEQWCTSRINRCAIVTASPCYESCTSSLSCLNAVIFEMEEPQNRSCNRLPIMFQVRRLRSLIRMLQVLNASSLDPHLDLPLDHG